MSTEKSPDNIFENQLQCNHKFKPGVNSIPVNKDNIYKMLGMTPADADDYVSGIIDRYIKECRDICNPASCYKFFAHPGFDLKNKTLSLDGKVYNLGKVVTSFMRKSRYVAVFISTCGKEIEKLSKQLMDEGHSLEGYIVDLIGSEMAEGIAGQVHDNIEDEAREAGCAVTNRYSPGYCNWPVTDQHNLFSLFGGDTCGVTLTPSSLMIPIKSVSGIFGIGNEVKRVAYKCHLCSDTHCVLRNKE